MRRGTWRAGLVSAIVVTAALGADEARAAGFQLKEQSAEGLGNAFAGSSAKATDLSTIFYNPAGMTRLSGSGGQADFAYVAPYSDFTGSATTPTGARALGADPDDAGENAILPSAYALWSATDDLRFGLAINTPWGMKTVYPDGWVGRYHALESDLATINVSPNVAYRVNRWLSVGAGAQVQYAKATLSNATFTPLGDVKSTVEGDDWGWGLAAGVLVEFDEKTRMGLAYRGRVRHSLEGEVGFENVPAPLSTTFAPQAARATLITPDTASLGVYRQLNDQWAVMAEVAWTNWSVFKDLKVDMATLPDSNTRENWEDGWFFALGATWEATKDVTLRGGVAYDASPVPDAFRTPRIPDEDRFWLSLGADWRIAPRTILNAGYTHIFVRESSLALNEPGKGALTGTYDNAVDIAGLGLRVSF
ncbi:MAG: TonB-dependent receptor [Alphaproteobacteria bacterium]|nr:TonB-dependent receptor [Alphaproteobacteria bacterium]